MNTGVEPVVSDAAAEGFILALLGMLGTVIVLCLVWWIISVIAGWKVFTKAGQKGWKSLIPVYSGFVMYKISWKTLWFWVTIGLSVITSFLSPRYEVNDAGEYVQTYGVSGFLSVILLICSIALAVISIMQLWKLAKSFGRGVGFFLGLLFLNSIFMLILAFGSSRYVGPEGIPANGQVAAPDEPDRLQGA